MFRLPKEKELTLALLDEFIGKHKAEVTTREEKLYKAYIGNHEILEQPKKAAYKPDNRIVVNFPKYSVDTMNGFFLGNPIKIDTDDEALAEFVEYIDQYNDQDDNNAELAKICSIYGHGFEMYYADEDLNLCITYLNPMEAFMIYDDSIVERPLYFVRRYKDYENNEWGSISNSYGVRHFSITGGIKWTDEDWIPHYFDGVPATEYIENGERLGLFEPVMSMVNAFNKALSEKANDVDYFADAYLKILGVALDEDSTRHIRENRIINFEGENSANVVVEFMNKPENDAAQENLLNRLETYIFLIGMVANISDENFGVSSGIALQYKLLAMHNLAKTKERKFTSGMNRRYKLLFSHPKSQVPADSWVKLHYKFTPNIPNNLMEEAQIAAQVEGITSKQTQLKILSIVDNVQEELAKIEEENKPDENAMIEQMMFGQAIAAQQQDLTEETAEQEEGGNSNVDNR